MSHSESIVGAFLHTRETAQPIGHPVLAEEITAAGEYLVGISLVPYVENQLVVRSIEYIMQTDDELDRAEARSQVPGIDSAYLYYILSDFRAQFPQLIKVQGPDVCGGIYFVKNLVHIRLRIYKLFN